jgi:hypothetical protein
MVTKDLHQRGFPGLLTVYYSLLLRLLPSVVAIGRYAQHVAR